MQAARLREHHAIAGHQFAQTLRSLASAASKVFDDDGDASDIVAPTPAPIVENVQGGSKFPVAVVVGVGIGVVAIILVTIGVVLWRKERAISKSLVNYISFLRDSPPPTTASGGGTSGGGREDSREAPPVPSIFESNSQNQRHHTDCSSNSVNSANVAADSLPRTTGGNDSFKGVLTGGSSNQTPRTVSWGSSSYFSSGMWDDPVIVAARLPLDKLQIEALISRGGYAEVFRGTYHNKQIALKRLLPDMRKDLREIEKFLSEAKLMATLEHVRIVKFVGVGWDSLADLCVVSEYMVGGDLRGLLHTFEDEQQRVRGFDREKVIIALHVAHAITYLHSLDPIVLHRDLKSKNILLDERMNAKVMDFGVSREQSDRTLTAGVGTLLWMAPEVMVGEKYDEKADVFSFGVVLSELDTHSMPYAHAKVSTTGRKVPDTAILQMVSSGKIRVGFSEPSDDSPLSLETASDLAQLCKTCVAFDARDRPTAAEVLYQLQRVLRAFDDADEILAELHLGL